MSRLFEGDYRRRPEQNLSGASRKSRKEELVSHAQLERSRRQEIRKQTEAAIVIQSYFRSYKVRHELKRGLRRELRERISGSIPTFQEFEAIIPLFLIGCDSQHEELEVIERLLDIYSNNVLTKMETDPKWAWNIQRLARMELKRGFSKSFIANFLNPKSSRDKIYQYLNNHDYFAHMGEVQVEEYPELLQWPFEILENDKAVEDFCKRYFCDGIPTRMETLIRQVVASTTFPKHKAYKAILQHGLPLNITILRLANELRPMRIEDAADYFKVLREASEVLVFEMEPEVSDDEDDDDDTLHTANFQDILLIFNEDWFSKCTEYLMSDDAIEPFVNFVFNLMVVGDNFGWKMPSKVPLKMWSVISSWSQYSEDFFTVDTESSKLIAFAAVFSANLVEIFKVVTDDEIDKISEVNLSDVGRFLIKVWLGLTHVAFVGESLPRVFNEVINDVRVAQAWRILFSQVTRSTKVLYKMYERRGMDIDWVIPHEAMTAPLTKQQAEDLMKHKPFQAKRPHTLSIQEARMSLILKEFPYVVPLLDRFRTLQHLIREEKSTTQPNWHFYDVPTIRINVRRGRMYEDAFNQLSESDHDLRATVRVQVTNTAGLQEPGIDGGGIFREFLAEVLTVGFNPNSGLFLQNNNNELYPNPNAYLLQRNASKHYNFLGKMLGKAIYENLLFEVPFALFFLEKLIGSSTLSANYLASLDPVLYKNLLNLKIIEVNDLGLDFTIQIDEYGKRRTVNLRNPNQSVTRSNIAEYIALVADYKLNQQLDRQTIAFHSGLFSILSPWWLQMFSSKELQLLISGTDSPIDLQDLQLHTSYATGIDATNPNIQRFWRVVQGFKNEERGLLLKFVTSCSRPPLLGFKELDPPFCIQNVEGERLPSASTCLNLLKLPEFEDDETMREKLLYAIKSGAGFELS